MELPEKQGLKHDWFGIEAVCPKGCSGTSRKTRIETQPSIPTLETSPQSCSGTSRKTRIETGRNKCNSATIDGVLQWNFQKNKD